MGYPSHYTSPHVTAYTDKRKKRQLATGERETLVALQTNPALRAAKSPQDASKLSAAATSIAGNRAILAREGVTEHGGYAIGKPIDPGSLPIAQLDPKAPKERSKFLGGIGGIQSENFLDFASDVLLRANYASATLATGLIRDVKGDNKGAAEAYRTIDDAFLKGGKHKKLYGDVFRDELGLKGPLATGAGIVADIALDPATYLFGIGFVGKGARLARFGMEAGDAKMSLSKAFKDLGRGSAETKRLGSGGSRARSLSDTPGIAPGAVTDRMLQDQAKKQGRDILLPAAKAEEKAATGFQKLGAIRRRRGIERAIRDEGGIRAFGHTIVGQPKLSKLSGGIIPEAAGSNRLYRAITGVNKPFNEVAGQTSFKARAGDALDPFYGLRSAPYAVREDLKGRIRTNTADIHRSREGVADYVETQRSNFTSLIEREGIDIGDAERVLVKTLDHGPDVTMSAADTKISNILKPIRTEIRAKLDESHSAQRAAGIDLDLVENFFPRVLQGYRDVTKKAKGMRPSKTRITDTLGAFSPKAHRTLDERQHEDFIARNPWAKGNASPFALLGQYLETAERDVLRRQGSGEFLGRAKEFDLIRTGPLDDVIKHSDELTERIQRGEVVSDVARKGHRFEAIKTVLDDWLTGGRGVAGGYEELNSITQRLAVGKGAGQVPLETLYKVFADSSSPQIITGLANETAAKIATTIHRTIGERDAIKNELAHMDAAIQGTKRTLMESRLAQKETQITKIYANKIRGFEGEEVEAFWKGTKQGQPKSERDLDNITRIWGEEAVNATVREGKKFEAATKTVVYGNQGIVESFRRQLTAGDFYNPGKFRRAMDAWKWWATVPNPGFWLRNKYSNKHQMFMSGNFAPFSTTARSLRKAFLADTQPTKHRGRMNNKIFQSAANIANAFVPITSAHRVDLEKPLWAGGPAARQLQEEMHMHDILGSGLLNDQVRNYNKMLRGDEGWVASKIPAVRNARETLHNFRKTVEEKVRYTIEDADKSALYLWERKGGASPDEAADAVFRSLFNYREVTPWERQVAKGVVPFYAWTRFNVPRQFQLMKQRPMRFAMFPGKIHDETEAGAVASSGEPDSFGRIPEYVSELRAPFIGKFPLTNIDDLFGGSKRELKSKDIFVNFGLPFADLNRLPSIGTSQDRKGLFGLSVDVGDLGSSIHPFIKTVPETILNVSTFRRGPIDTAGRSSPPSMRTAPPWTEWAQLHRIPGNPFKFSIDPDKYTPGGRAARVLPAKSAHVLENLNPWLNNVGKGLVNDEKQASNLISQLTGVKLIQVDNDMLSRNAIYAEDARLKAIVSELRKQRKIPTYEEELEFHDRPSFRRISSDHITQPYIDEVYAQRGQYRAAP